jgi:hypothetical protein
MNRKKFIKTLALGTHVILSSGNGIAKTSEDLAIPSYL